MTLCIECGGTGTIFGFGAMKVQCPICDGKRIIDIPAIEEKKEKDAAGAADSKERKGIFKDDKRQGK